MCSLFSVLIKTWLLLFKISHTFQRWMTAKPINFHLVQRGMKMSKLILYLCARINKCMKMKVMNLIVNIPTSFFACISNANLFKEPQSFNFMVNSNGCHFEIVYRYVWKIRTSCEINIFGHVAIWFPR